MVKIPIKAVIWDLDGTLIHFKIDFIRARRETFTILRKHGIAEEHLSLKMGIVDTFNIASKIFKAKGLTEQDIKGIIQEVDQVVIKIEQEAALNASMIEGIDKVLEFNKKNQLKQAVYTYNNSNNAKISLETVNLLSYFSLIAGRDSIENPKPHPDHLRYICENLNVDPSEIVVIGDHARDMEGAINLGAYSIGLHSKLAKRETLQIADVIVEESEIPLKLIECIARLI